MIMDSNKQYQTENSKEILNDSYGIVDLALDVLKAGEKNDDYGVQEAIKELTGAAMNYFADVVNQ